MSFPRGECQECGGEFATFGAGTRVARHGFSRYHGRECPGSRRLPVSELRKEIRVSDTTPQRNPEDELAETPQRAALRLRSQLWNAIWGASQVMEPDEMRTFFEGTLAEIASDEP